MTKATKLIIATIVLGGLGYFLYKKGLFSNTTTTEVAKDVKVDDVVKKVEDIVKEVVDTGKKTAVEPEVKEIVKVPIYDPNTNTLVYDTVIGTPVQVPIVNPIYNDSYYQAIVYPSVNDTYGGLRPIENDYIVNPTVQQDWWNQGYSNSYNMDFKLGIDENYKYK